MPYTREWGSQIAKGGFAIEEIIRNTFENWDRSPDAKDWLEVMGYNLSGISGLSADAPRSTHKADLVLNINSQRGTRQERVTIKKTKNSSYNQVSKRSVDDYAEMFGLSSLTVKGLKKYCGEEGYKPQDLVDRGEFSSSKLSELYDARYHDPPIRLAFGELSQKEKESIENDFTEKSRKIVQTVLAGDPMEVEWYLVVRAQKNNGGYDIEKTMFEPIKDTIDRHSQGGFTPSPRSSFKVGKITVQRKGGTPDPEKLQFKMNPWA